MFQQLDWEIHFTQNHYIDYLNKTDCYYRISISPDRRQHALTHTTPDGLFSPME